MVVHILLVKNQTVNRIIKIIWYRAICSIPLFKHNSIALILGIVFCLYSCGEKGTNKENLVSIKINTPFNQLLNGQSRIDYTDSVYRCIALETNDQCYLGKVKKMKVQGDRIFLLDVTSKALLCFDMEGKYLFKISAIDKGPGEYLNINDFDVGDTRIVLLDINGFKLLMYDISGNFIKEKKLRQTALRALCIHNQEIYTYTVSTPRQDETMKKNWIVVYNDNFKAIKKMEVPELSPLSRHTSISDYFFTMNHRLFFCKSYEQTIFEIEEKQLKPYLGLNFLRISKEIDRLSQLLKDPQAVFCTGRINAANDSLLFMQFCNKGKRYELVYNDNQKKMYVNGIESAYSYTKGQTNEMMFMTLSDIRCSANDRLYTLCEVAQVKSKANMIRAMGDKAIKDEVINTLIDSSTNLDELQNPVVFCNTYYEK